MILGPVLRFDGARLKIKRAEHHIDELERQFELFVERKPYSLTIGNHPKTDQPSVRVKFKEAVPSWLSLIVGDAVHNLRTSLDHMVWELIGHDGGEQNRHLKFPAGDNRVSFESSCQGIRTPSQSVIDVLKAFEVFPGGKGESLYALNLLDNADKHTVITPVIRSARISKLTIFNADGTTYATLADNEIGGGTSEYMLLANAPRGGYIEIDNDTKVTPNISFGYIEPLPPFQPIIPTLRQFRDAVSHTIDNVAGVIT
jgi:hypothetical protein